MMTIFGGVKSSGYARLLVSRLLFVICAVGSLVVPELAYSAEPTAPVACDLNAGPQAPRDIAVLTLGTNKSAIKNADLGGSLNLCNIHFHRNAEHKVADSKSMLVAAASPGFVCKRRGATDQPGPAQERGHGVVAGASHTSAHATCDSVTVGETIEVHWVFTSCKSPDKPTLEGLGNCTLCESPVLRVHAKVFLIADDNDKEGMNFADFAEAGEQSNPFAVKGLPLEKGAVEYVGSTTGGSYNNDSKCSPFTANWIVQRECSPLNVSSLKSWCSKNIFEEKVVHDVRSLVTSPALLSVAKTR